MTKYTATIEDTVQTVIEDQSLISLIDKIKEIISNPESGCKHSELDLEMAIVNGLVTYYIFDPENNPSGIRGFDHCNHHNLLASINIVG